MALCRVHTSTKAQQCPLIHSTSNQNQTHSHVTIIPLNVTLTRGMTCPHVTMTLSPLYPYPNLNVTWFWIPSKSNRFFMAHVLPFHRILWKSVE